MATVEPFTSAMANRSKDVLINPTWEQMLERDPLMAFSHYLSGRVHVLLDFADEIKANLDQGFSGQCVEHERIARAESLMWLWILGAYEVVRTICQAKTCFTQRVQDEMSQLKKTLSAVRMPAAKMEKPGQKVPVTSNRSPSGWDLSRRDLFVNDPLSANISARDLLANFERVFASMKPTDVLARHESGYAGHV